MWWNTHYTNGEAISHQFIMLLDPPKREKLGQSWDTLKWKKFRCLFCFLDYSEHINFSSFQCFITFMDSCKVNLVLGNFIKKLGFGQTPPPLVGTKSQLFPFFLRLLLGKWKRVVACDVSPVTMFFLKTFPTSYILHIIYKWKCYAIPKHWKGRSGAYVCGWVCKLIKIQKLYHSPVFSF